MKTYDQFMESVTKIASNSNKEGMNLREIRNAADHYSKLMDVILAATKVVENTQHSKTTSTIAGNELKIVKAALDNFERAVVQLMEKVETPISRDDHHTI